MKALSIALCTLLAASCATTPPAEDWVSPWDGVPAPELDRIGLVEVRQAFEGTETNNDQMRAFVTLMAEGEDPNHGVQVVRLQAGDAAGLQVGDIIVAVGTDPVRSIADLTERITAWAESKAVPLTVRRAGLDAGPVRPTLDGVPELVIEIVPHS